MSKIQIKRYNAGTSTWESQFPITKAQHLVANNGNTPVFDENDKLKVNYLPNEVFDSLHFFSVANSSQLSDLVFDALIDANDLGTYTNGTGRSIKGYYWVNNYFTGTSGHPFSSALGSPYPNIELVNSIKSNFRAFDDLGVFAGSEPCFFNGNPIGVFTPPQGVNKLWSSDGNIYAYSPFQDEWEVYNFVGMIPSQIGSGMVNGELYFSINARRVFQYNGATGTLGALTPIVVSNDVYITTQFKNKEETTPAGSTIDTVSFLEKGDWFVITNVTGSGTQASPYLVSFATVNNTYELATEFIHGIVKLSNQNVWANLSGNNVVTDFRLKSLVDGQFQPQLNTLANRVRVFYDGTPTGMVTDDLWFDAV
jgi:hypothetical protein